MPEWPFHASRAISAIAKLLVKLPENIVIVLQGTRFEVRGWASLRTDPLALDLPGWN